MSNPCPWEIRNATVNDIELIRSLCQRIWPATYSHMLSVEQLDYMMDWMYSPSSLQQQMKEGAQFLILYYKGADQQITKAPKMNQPASELASELASEPASEPAGYASFQEIGDNHYKLHKLYVLPELQGLGAGRFFMEQIIQKVSRAGGHSIELQVNRSNKAVGFYQRTGFRIIKEADFPIGNDYFMNDYIMQIDLKA